MGSGAALRPDQCCPLLVMEARRQGVLDVGLLAVAAVMTPPWDRRGDACRHIGPNVSHVLTRCGSRSSDVITALRYLRTCEGHDWERLAQCFIAGLSPEEAAQALGDPEMVDAIRLVAALADRPGPVVRSS